MRILNTTIFAAFIAISFMGVARADEISGNPVLRDPEQVREQIERLYRLEQAFLACDQVRMTGQDLKRLDDAIADIEMTSGLPASDFESIYDQVEKAATESPDAFCSAMSDATGDLRAMPISEWK
jgi:hypothetical protein